MSENNNIPKHWQALKVSQIGNLFRGVNYKKEEATTIPTENYLPVLRGNNINGILNFDDLVYVQQKNISEEQLVQKGDIVFAMSSGSKHLVGKSAKAMSDFKGGFGAFCGVFRANETVNKDFIAYFFQSPYYKKVISEISKGTNINNLKREHILDLDFPSPPIPEQQLIVSKIEELLSDLDNGKQQLQIAQQQLKVYRQSLLKWLYDKSFGSVPVKLVDVCDFITKGTTPSKDKLFSTKGDVPFLKVYNLTFNGTIDFSKDPTYVENETHNVFLKRSIVYPDDVLMNIVGPPLGKVSIVPSTFSEWNINQAIVRFRCKEKLFNKYLLYFLLCENTIRTYSRKAKATAGQFNLTLEICRDIEIPLPSIKEQQLIVDELENKLTVCDKIEETINQGLLQAETLRQSILKKAFEGKLV